MLWHCCTAHPRDQTGPRDLQDFTGRGVLPTELSCTDLGLPIRLV